MEKQITLNGTETESCPDCGHPMRFLDIYGGELAKKKKAYFCDECFRGFDFDIATSKIIIENACNIQT